MSQWTKDVSRMNLKGPSCTYCTTAQFGKQTLLVAQAPLVAQLPPIILVTIEISISTSLVLMEDFGQDINLKALQEIYSSDLFAGEGANVPMP